ncbi:psbP domain-containing protein 7, chloroplastic-like [Lolium rigidum]|uniref:psbP domain-containing protein 7, chloroplastic-like n=1 Tax=Lolium rigidum TaxID=89674 RepID=UPI001F5CE5D9|nr:psbP domain-containing protein 7, chloroplastic-like [Lolium rigidum]
MVMAMPVRLALRCCHKLATVAVDASELCSFEYRGAVPEDSFLTVRGGGGFPYLTSCKVDICAVCVMVEATSTSEEELVKLSSFLRKFMSTKQLHLCSNLMGSCFVRLPAFPILRHLQLHGRRRHRELYDDYCYFKRTDADLLDAHHLHYNQYETLDVPVASVLVPACLGSRIYLKYQYIYLPICANVLTLRSCNSAEFIYPANWVGDQTILYNQVRKAEQQRSLDPPPLSNGRLSRPQNTSGPVAAFGPPGSNGELNVSVIVSPVPQDFSIESFGGPKDVGEVVLRRIARTKRNPDIRATLIDASLREDAETNVKYYKLEFCVESPSFRRHNVAVCCVRDGRLYTLNAQAPESAWKAVQKEFFAMADSFSLVIDV